MGLRVWLDDIRPAPAGYEHVYTVEEIIKLLETGKVERVSLDHDLGDDRLIGTGTDVANWIEEHAFLGDLPRLEWNVHSANPVGAKRMEQALRNADKFWANPRHRINMLVSAIRYLGTTNSIQLRARVAAVL